ncbi:hypothetical protein TNCT_375531 [Trichonephila clavata]|uniref:Uncharacterized protein n=1 Tax=Trichonephila clavata TaxID=2740835 RepID=A0A8X6FKS1_TRICU|nr:hypothetical protein TNCT_375531 [Trichonephila clavata]
MPSAGDFFQSKRRSLAGRIRRFLSAHRNSLPNYFRSIFDPKPIHTPSGGRAERKGVPRRIIIRRWMIREFGIDSPGRLHVKSQLTTSDPSI